MNKLSRVTTLFSLIVAKLSVIIVFGLVGFELYVRWKVNQQFTLLGGSGFEVLTASTFALVIALAYIHRPRQ